MQLAHWAARYFSANASRADAGLAVSWSVSASRWYSSAENSAATTGPGTSVSLARGRCDCSGRPATQGGRLCLKLYRLLVQSLPARLAPIPRPTHRIYNMDDALNSWLRLMAPKH